MIIFAITWYIIGLLLFLTLAVFDTPYWDALYFLWDKAKDVLLIWAIMKPAPFSSRWMVLPILIYSVIRFLWEIISLITGLTVNNTKAVGIMFIMALIVCTYITIQECLKQRR